jgi:hypothetical protein
VAGRLGPAGPYALGQGRFRYRSLVNVAGFKADIKEMAAHRIFYNFVVPIADFVNAYYIAVFNFFQYIKKFNPAGPAFYKVTFHYQPP